MVKYAKYLLILSVILFALIAGLVLFIGNVTEFFVASDKTARAFVSNLSKQVLETSVNHFSSAVSVLNLNKAVLEPGTGFAGESADEFFQRLSLSQLGRDSKLSSLYLADREGNFWMSTVEENGSVSTLIVKQTKGPGTFPQSADSRRAEWIYRSEAGALLGREAAPAPAVDPRDGAWFKRAALTNKTGWTSAYFFPSEGKHRFSGKAGISLSGPIFDGNRIVAVLGADLLLDDLSLALARLRLGSGVKAYVLDAEASVLAGAEPEAVLVKEEFGKKRFKSVKEIDGGVLASLYQKIGEPGRSSRISLAGGDYLVSRELFPLETGLHWTLIVYTSDDVLNGSQKNTVFLLFFCTLLFFTLVLLLAAGLISFYQSNAVHKDALSGLFTRKYFEEVWARELGQAEKLRRPVSLAIVAFDQLETFSAERGFAAGDRILESAGSFVNSHLRHRDFAARYSAKEFVLLMPDTTKDTAYFLLNRLREEFGKTPFFLPDGGRTNLSFSAGICVFPGDNADRFRLLETAERALAEAQRQGGNRCVNFSEVLV